MTDDFFRFFDDMISRGHYMHLEIGYNKVADYCISVYLKGMGEDGNDLKIAWAQDCDVNLAFAKAYCELKKWFVDNRGGY